MRYAIKKVEVSINSLNYNNTVPKAIQIIFYTHRLALSISSSVK